MLYSLHLKHNNTQSDGIFEVLQKMEEKCLDELSEFLNKYAEGSGVLEELDDLMKDCVETEVKFYR